MNPPIATPPNLPKDTHSYKGWLNSDSFLKRAFSIYGYMMVAGLIIMIPFYIIMLIIMFSFFQFIPNITRQIESKNPPQIKNQPVSEYLSASQYCLDVFRKTEICPEDLCEFGCIGGGEGDIGGCVGGCIPKAKEYR